MKRNRVHILVGILACCMMIASCGDREGATLPQTTEMPTLSATVELMGTEAPVTIIPQATATQIPETVQTDHPMATEHKDTQTPEPSTAPEEESISLVNMEQMEEILTSIACYMEEGGSYSATKEESYYELMYVLANNVAYLYGNDLYEEDNDEIKINQKAMQDLSAVAFAGRGIIGNIPEEYSNMLEYDWKNQVYIAMASDASQIDGEVTAEKRNDNGTYTVCVRLTEEETGKSLGQYEFTLMEYKRVSNEVPGLFYYSIKDVKSLNK